MNVGDKVQWTYDVPATWRFIYTPGPMEVTLVQVVDTEPTVFARRFGPTGMNLTPGKLYTVKFPWSEYYGDLARLPHLVYMTIHQKWLEPLRTE